MIRKWNCLAFVAVMPPVAQVQTGSRTKTPQSSEDWQVGRGIHFQLTPKMHTISQDGFPACFDSFQLFHVFPSGNERGSKSRADGPLKG